MNPSATQLIQQLGLQKHPEGGYFKETYRSKGEIPKNVLSDQFTGSRNYATGIYFLLTSDSFSAFHKIHQDEMWHFYQGAPVTIHMISPEGNYRFQELGPNLDGGQLPQFVVPGEYWFASEVRAMEQYALTGCTVSPGFDFEDFTLADQNELLTAFPQHADVIRKLTRI